jgi:SnoaL-like domain
MTAFPRDEMEEMVERWLQVNRDAEAAGDWEAMALMYAEDATYGWNYGPTTEFMAVGRDEIRDIALGQEMGGLDGWEYPYQEILIDEKKGQVVGFWKQIATSTRADGSGYEVAGIGGSWFGYAGDLQWAWQRDWFDLGNATACFLEMLGDGTLSEGMTARMHRPLGGSPGHYDLGTAPAPTWPPTAS